MAQLSIRATYVGGPTALIEVDSVRFLTADDRVPAATAMPNAAIVPLHYKGCEHFSERRTAIERALSIAGFSARLRWLIAGQPTALPNA